MVINTGDIVSSNDSNIIITSAVLSSSGEYLYVDYFYSYNVIGRRNQPIHKDKVKLVAEAKPHEFSLDHIKVVLQQTQYGKFNSLY